MWMRRSGDASVNVWPDVRSRAVSSALRSTGCSDETLPHHFASLARHQLSNDPVGLPGLPFLFGARYVAGPVNARWALMGPALNRLFR